MKFSAILAVISLAIGFAIGWIAKPAPPASEAQAKVTNDTPKISDRKEPTPSANSIEKSDRKNTPSVAIYNGKGTEDMSEEDKAEIQKGQDMFQKMMAKSQKSKLDARISKLVSQLNLSPEQEAALRKTAEESLANISASMNGGFDPSNLEDLTGEKSLENTLAEILNDEQKEEHEALKKREFDNKVEATALKRLAKLSKLDMTPEQKDAAYDILYKEAEESASKKSPGNDIFATITSGFGIEMDAEDIGLDFSVEDFSADADNGEAHDQKDYMAQMKERQQARIDEKVEALRPVLDDAQLEQYRTDLESRSQNVFGGMFNELTIEAE